MQEVTGRFRSIGGPGFTGCDGQGVTVGPADVHRTFLAEAGGIEQHHDDEPCGERRDDGASETPTVPHTSNTL